MQIETQGWTIHIFDDHFRGYFENDETGVGGELLFERRGDVIELIDYDGVFELPRPVFKALGEQGIHMEPEFDPDYEIGEHS